MEIATMILDAGVVVELVKRPHMGDERFEAWDRSGRLYAHASDKAAVIAATVAKIGATIPRAGNDAA